MRPYRTTTSVPRLAVELDQGELWVVQTEPEVPSTKFTTGPPRWLTRDELGELMESED